ncbi:XapX domain-containing protein [Salmonella enterica subsp. enterica]|nr:XapX domain-containing protein [Salmonella enterica subsp. enterica]
MKEIILSSGIGFGIGAFFYFMPYTYSRTKCFTRVLSIVFMYIGYLVVKSIFY